MQISKPALLAFFILLYGSAQVYGQKINPNLIVGKWEYVKTQFGSPLTDYNYNGRPMLTFESNGTWITEDTNRNYRQSGTWKIENNNLIRDADKFASGDGSPYARKIEKLTEKELVFSAYPVSGQPTLTFYFIKIEP